MKIVVTQGILGKQCTWLRLEKNQMTSKGISTLATAFEKRNYLEGLGLFGNQLSDAGVQSLILAFSSPRNLVTSLGLGNNGITDKGAGYLVEILKRNRTITQLRLQGNEITDQGVELLISVIETQSTHIQELDLSDNRLVTDLSVNSFFSLIQHNQVLRGLWVYGCNLSSNAKEQLLKIKQLKRRLDLRV